MKLRSSLTFIIILLITIMASLAPGRAAYSLQANQSRLENAARRSQNAAKTIKVVAGMPEDETIPAEIFNRAEVIAVFPDVVKMNLLFSQGMKGYGVMCSRQPGGWSLPAYYGFGSSTYSLKIAGGKSFDLIILFMNKDAVKWFQGGRLEFKGIKTGLSGPVGKWSQRMELRILGANIFMYALVDGKLKGMDLEEQFSESAILNPDNNINQAVYEMKGREVLQGKAPKSLPAKSEVTAFRDILNEKFPVTK